MFNSHLDQLLLSVNFVFYFKIRKPKNAKHIKISLNNRQPTFNSCRLNKYEKKACEKVV